MLRTFLPHKSAGDTSVNSADAAASGGSLSYGNFNAVGDWIQYTVNVPSAGTYIVSSRVKKHPDRGTAQLYIDGIAQGNSVDQRQSSTNYTTVSFGEVTFASPGNKQFRLQITGKDPSSNSYTLANDTFSLTKIN
ncbi:carbohydrate-binding protein [Paenibacillus phytorum]|nr:carbohydrate-binding protein [Paenibacillus phytorum]